MTRCHLTDEPRPAPEYPESDATVEPVHDRERLILDHLWQVRIIALQIKKRLPDWVSLDDLQSVGTLGLLAAVDRFDARRQVTLRTYAEHKIRSSILESLRSQDWASRDRRDRIRLLAQTTTLLIQRHQRPPTEEEMAAELGLTMPRYQTWRSECQDLSPKSLDGTAAGHKDKSLKNSLPDSAARLPSELAERAEQESLLRKAVGRMPERERTILALYYYEELTLAEIAKILDLDQSRVSQLKSQAVRQLRSYLLPAQSCRQNNALAA